MQMTRERKILAAVLGTGLLAMGVDRLVLDAPATSPQAAEAGVGFTAALVADQQTPPAMRQALPELEPVRESTLAARLLEAAQEQALTSNPPRDAFAPAGAWALAEGPAPAQQSTAEAELRHFQQHHRLMAVMTPGAHGVVVVNGQPLRPGHQLAGFTLTSVDRHSATFTSPAGEVVLKLDPTR